MQLANRLHLELMVASTQRRFEMARTELEARLSRDGTGFAQEAISLSRAGVRGVQHAARVERDTSRRRATSWRHTCHPPACMYGDG